MPIPNTPDFEQLLSSITRLNPQSEEFQSIIIKDEIMEVHSNGKSTKKKPVLLWYRIKSNISIKSLLAKVISVLSGLGHTANDDIAKTVLLLFTFQNDETDGAVTNFNKFLNFHCICEVSQYFVANDTNAGYFVPVPFGDFIISNLDGKQLEYKCKRADSDYFERFGDGLVNRPSIVRKNFTTTILNCHELLQTIGASNQHEFLSKCLLYFEAVSHLMFEEFWTKFNDQQNLHVSTGLPVILDKYFRERVRSEYITVFLKIPLNGVNKGYVVPMQLGDYHVSVSYQMGPAIYEFYRNIKDQYLFSEFEASELHQTFKTFCKFVGKGYRYLEEKRNDEGFLHFVIALDLVFGDKNESTKSITNRCALLSLKDLKDYASQKKKVAELYDARSRYVHAGQSVKEEFISDVKEICKELVYCFLRLQHYYTVQKKVLTIDQWKKKLDFVCSALDASEPLSNVIKLEVGLDSCLH